MSQVGPKRRAARRQRFDMFRITLRLMGCGISATTLGAFGKHFVPKAHHLKYLEGFVADMRKHK